MLPEDLIACRQTKKHHHRSDDEDDDFIDEDIPRNSRYSLSMGSSNSNTNSLWYVLTVDFIFIIYIIVTQSTFNKNLKYIYFSLCDKTRSKEHAIHLLGFFKV